MFSTLHFFLSFTYKRRKVQVLIFMILTLVSSALEVFSLGAIFPFVSVFVDSSLIFENTYLKPILDYLEINHPTQIYLPITIAFFIVTTLSYFLKAILIFLRTSLARIINQEISAII